VELRAAAEEETSVKIIHSICHAWNVLIDKANLFELLEFGRIGTNPALDGIRRLL
jgi:hypothetical protein